MTILYSFLNGRLIALRCSNSAPVKKVQLRCFPTHPLSNPEFQPFFILYINYIIFFIIFFKWSPHLLKSENFSVSLNLISYVNLPSLVGCSLHFKPFPSILSNVYFYPKKFYVTSQIAVWCYEIIMVDCFFCRGSKIGFF